MQLGSFDTVFALGVCLNLSYLVFPQLREVIISLALSSIEDLIKELNLWFEDEMRDPRDTSYKAIFSGFKTIEDQLEALKRRSANIAMKFSYVSFAFSLICIVLLYYCIVNGQQEVDWLKLVVFSVLSCFAPFIGFSLFLWFYIFKEGRSISFKLEFIDEIKKVKTNIESATKELEKD